MFTLTHDQRYIADILEETRALRTEQVYKLLWLLDEGKDGVYAQRVLKQLHTVNYIYWVSDNTVTLPHLRNMEIDADMLSAVDVMLNLLESPPVALSSGKQPFKLSFLMERDGDVLTFGVAVAVPGEEEKLSFSLSNLGGDFIVIFLLSDLRQSELLKTSLEHYFAIPDDDRLRYFKGSNI